MLLLLINGGQFTKIRVHGKNAKHSYSFLLAFNFSFSLHHKAYRIAITCANAIASISYGKVFALA